MEYDLPLSPVGSRWGERLLLSPGTRVRHGFTCPLFPTPDKGAKGLRFGELTPTSRNSQTEAPQKERTRRFPPGFLVSPY